MREGARRISGGKSVQAEGTAGAKFLRWSTLSERGQMGHRKEGVSSERQPKARSQKSWWIVGGRHQMDF